MRSAILLIASLLAVETVQTDRITLAGRADLVYHPSDFIESTGSLAIRRGDLGWRSIGSDGMVSMILATSNSEVRLEAVNGYTSAYDRRLTLESGTGELALENVDEENGFLVLSLNGRTIWVPFQESPP